MVKRFHKLSSRLVLIASAVVLGVTTLIPVQRVGADTLGSIAAYDAGWRRPYGIVEGTDGNLWYTLETEKKIGKITKSGTKTEYALPTTSLLLPNHIAVGPNGNLWFGVSGSLKYGQIDYNGTINIYNLPSNSSMGPSTGGVAAGSDGNVWVGGMSNSGTAGYVHVANDQGVSLGYYTIPGIVVEIAADPANNQIWYAARGTGAYAGSQLIGKISEDGTVSTPYVAPSGTTNLFTLTVASDGKVWFGGGDKIGNVDNNGNFSSLYSLPASSGAWRMREGLDGNMWVTLGGSHKIGKITPAGVVTTYFVGSSTRPIGITAGTDGNMWFTQYDNNKISKIGTGVSGTTTDVDSDGLNAGQELAQATSDRDADTDNDGLSDYVESTSYPNRTAAFCGTTCTYPKPLRKDVYLETDWMETTGFSAQPNLTQVAMLRDAFHAKGISLHIDYGYHGGGNQVPYSSLVQFNGESGVLDFFDYKLGGDGMTAQFDSANRLGIWHYMLLGDRYSESPGSSGKANPGDDDSFVSYGLIVDDPDDKISDFDAGVAGTILHELSHNLCLLDDTYYATQHNSCVFSGIDTDSSSDYESAMNYEYQFDLVDLSTGVNGANDHNDWYALKLYGIDDFVGTHAVDPTH